MSRRKKVAGKTDKEGPDTSAEMSQLSARMTDYMPSMQTNVNMLNALPT